MKKLTFIVFGLVLIALGYFWLNTAPTAQVKDPTTYVSSNVPAPASGQKKVVFKNLGMT